MRLKRLITIVTLTVLVGMSVSADAQEMTLNDCIELALQNRLSIIRARGDEDLANANKRASLGSFLPRVDASYDYSKGKETSIDPMLTTGDPTSFVPAIDTFVVGNDTAFDAAGSFSSLITSDEQDIGPSKSLNVSANMWILNIGNFYSYSAAKSDAEAAHLNVIDSEQNLIYEVKFAYFAYLAAVQNVAVQEDAVERAEEQLKLIQSRYDLGSASLSDVLKQKVQFGNDQLALLRAQHSVTTTKAELSYTIGIDPNGNHNFSAVYSTHDYSGSLEDAISFGLEHEPGYLGAQKSLSSASKSVSANKAGYLPNLSAFASYTKFNGTQAFPTAFDYSSNTLRYGFSVSWNIFDGFLRERSVTSAKVVKNNAMATVSDTKHFLIRDIKTSFYEIEQQKTAKEIAQANVEAAEEDLKITQEKYNLGAATILDLLTAQVSLKTAQVSLIRADFDLSLAVAKLEKAMGKM